MEYKVINGHDEYCVDRFGRIYRIKKDGLHEIQPDCSNGYARVRLNGKSLTVHRIVAEAFIDILDPAQDKVFHIDGNNLNNEVSNLCWGTASEVQLWSHYTPEYRISHFTPKG